MMKKYKLQEKNSNYNANNKTTVDKWLPNKIGYFSRTSYEIINERNINVVQHRVSKYAVFK